MKRCSVLLLVIAFFCAGCAAMQENKKTAVGAVAGTAVGAGVGYGLGGGTGAALGAAAGGLAGGGIGQMMDSEDRDFRQALSEAQQREQAFAMSAVQREKDAIILTFKADVLFDKNSSTLKTGAYSSGEIDRVAHILNKYPDTKIRIEGYADSIGSDLYNQQLSEQRAHMVKNVLISKNVEAARITAIGLGKSCPVADNTSEAGRRLNRRVAIVIQPDRQQQSQPEVPASTAASAPQPQQQPQNQEVPAVYAPSPVIYGPPPFYYLPPVYYVDPYFGYGGYGYINVYHHGGGHHYYPSHNNHRRRR